MTPHRNRGAVYASMAPLRRARRRRGHVPLLSLLSLLAALAQIMADAAAGANAEVADDAAGDTTDILFTVTQPARSTTAESCAPSLGQHVVAPSEVASAGGLARQIDSNTWHVPQHVPLVTFLYSTGPPEITRYNFKLVWRRIDDSLVQRQPYLQGSGYSAADTYALTARGNERLESKPRTKCFTWEMACTGRAAHGKAAPNCQRRG